MIMNEHADGYGSGDTEGDFTWREHNEAGNEGEIVTESRVIALKNDDRHNLLEERYQKYLRSI